MLIVELAHVHGHGSVERMVDDQIERAVIGQVGDGLGTALRSGRIEQDDVVNSVCG